MQRQRGTLNAHYQVKEFNLKRLRTKWLQLCNILEKAKNYYRDSKIKKDQWLEMGREEGAAHGGFLGQ